MILTQAAAQVGQSSEFKNKKYPFGNLSNCKAAEGYGRFVYDNLSF